MNKHFYRIVFNKVRGLLMVVSEIVRSHQGEGHSTQKAKAVKAQRKIQATLKPLTFMTYIGLGMVSLVNSSYASTIVVDSSADKSQRASVTSTANGITQVNISAASSAGVSHNKFTQFDVSQQGAILNNSSQTSKTELAGYIDGNKSLLVSGSAKVILNEINSRNASSLNGYIEVAGQKAQVVVANAAGITCDGCGFINANRATLTTGQPVMENGQLKGYLVDKGNIDISGQGMDSSKQDYTDIFAKTVTINAGLWANDVSVVTGENNVSRDLSKIEKQTAENKEKPQFAVDVAALGGMYAGKIQLIGTESGVGVHNAGQLGASAGSIHISVDGKIENTGKINSNDAINITTQTSLVNQGDISTKQGSITVSASSSINNQGTITSQSDLQLTTQGNLFNSGNIAAKNALSINAHKTLTNQGSIVSTDTLNINSNQIDNTNLINAESLQIISQQLNNLGTGRIYGTDIALQTEELNNLAENGTASTIASRGTLNIAANTINNYGSSLIYSAGDMNIGGTLNDDLTIAGSANVINNHSSSIESGANLIINADEINNINDDIKVEVVDKSVESIHEYQMVGDTQRYTADQVSFYNSGSVLILCLINGECSENYYEYQFIRTVKDSVITASSPSQIMAADNLTINAKNILNDNSKIIAGNDLITNAIEFNNKGVEGKQFTQDNGFVTIYSKEQRTKVNKWDYFHWFTEKYDVSVSTQKIYSPSDVIQTIYLNSAIKEDHSALVKQDTNEPNKLGENNSTLSLPTLNSLYQLNPSQNSHYLIETDTTFTNYKEFISSDYMLEQLKIEPDNVLKRLGDGYYEQKMVKEQLIEATGSRYLDGYNNDATQYQALMTEGAKFAEKYNLSLGVELTAEQMNELTSDIVWFVSKSVDLPDSTSQDVLVPHVYIKGNVSVDGSGALVSANNSQINLTGNFENNGKVITKNNLSIKADTVNNQKAGVISANVIDISADKDINNTGGSIVAGDSLALTASQNINLVSTTNHAENIVGSSSFSHTNIDSVSSLIVKNNNASMVLKAGNTINAVGASLVASGEESAVSLNADTINLTTQQEQSAQSIRFDKDNYVNQKTTTETGSNIVSNGSIELNATNKIDVHGSNLSASDKLSLESAYDINITDVKESVEYNDYFKQTSSIGLFSTKTTTTESHINNILSSQSQLSGNLVEIKSGKDINVIGSQVVGSSDVTLNAGENINIAAGEESYQSASFSETKKSGFLSSGGGIGFSYGTEKETDDYKSKQQNYSSSTIGSTGGNISLISGKDISVAASDIISKNDINIEGENVTITSNDAVIKNQESQTYKKTSLNLELTGTSSGLQELLTMKNIFEPIKSIGVNTTISTQFTKKELNQEQHNIVSSNLSAGQNVIIKAKGNDQYASGNITLKGSNINSGNDTTLEANHNLNVLAAANSQYSNEKKYDRSVGIQINADASGPEFKVSANHSVENESINSRVWSDTIINSGNNLTIRTSNDTNIIGGQLSGKSLKVDIANDLNIKTQQDFDEYDYNKNSASIDTTIGTIINANLSTYVSNINSNLTSTTNQAGIFSGSDGYDITVGNNTSLKGAVIASNATDASNNKLDTGTINFSDIDNKGNFDVISNSITIGTFQISIPTYYNGDNKNSTTKSAVENGELTVRNENKQNMDNLIRDTAKVSNPLAKFFDQQKELDKLALAKDKNFAEQLESLMTNKAKSFVFNKVSNIVTDQNIDKVKNFAISKVENITIKNSDNAKSFITKQINNISNDQVKNLITDKIVDFTTDKVKNFGSGSK